MILSKSICSFWSICTFHLQLPGFSHSLRDVHFLFCSYSPNRFSICILNLIDFYLFLRTYLNCHFLRPGHNIPVFLKGNWSSLLLPTLLSKGLYYYLISNSTIKLINSWNCRGTCLLHLPFATMC